LLLLLARFGRLARDKLLIVFAFHLIRLLVVLCAAECANAVDR
jgi:hypothetical protein